MTNSARTARRALNSGFRAAAARTLWGLPLLAVLTLLGACSSGSSGVLFVNASTSTLSVAGGSGEAVVVAPGASATAPAWGTAGSLTVSETDSAGAAAGRYSVPLVRSGPATITARGPRGQLLFDVADPRTETTAQERQIRRDVIDRPTGNFNR
ncbi:MAG: hypothetical protein ACKVS8_09955 [Phycisphaerales bacterium]